MEKLRVRALEEIFQLKGPPCDRKGKIEDQDGLEKIVRVGGLVGCVQFFLWAQPGIS